MAGAGAGKDDFAIEDTGAAGEARLEGAGSGGCGCGSAERGENLTGGSGRAMSVASDGVPFRDFEISAVSLAIERPAVGAGADSGKAGWTGAGVDSLESPVRSTMRPDAKLLADLLTGFDEARDDRRSIAGRAGLVGLAGLAGISSSSSSSSSVRSMIPCPPTMGILRC